jgi:hypothetical protein
MFSGPPLIPIFFQEFLSALVDDELMLTSFRVQDG